MNPKRMRVSEHAIRRYKKRIGKKTASRQNVINEITRLVRKAWRQNQYKYSEEQYSNGYSKFVLINCGSFIAIASKNAIITVYSKNSKMDKADVYQEFITASAPTEVKLLEEA